MKKLLCAAFAVLVLAGCSGGAKTETKTCSMEQSGFKMDATFTAEDDSITKTSVKVTMDLSSAGLGDDTKLTDDQKKQLETAVFNQLGFPRDKLSGRYRYRGSDGSKAEGGFEGCKGTAGFSMYVISRRWR